MKPSAVRYESHPQSGCQLGAPARSLSSGTEAVQTSPPGVQWEVKAPPSWRAIVA